jgi:predicted N-acetyltransferase YhbS
MPQSVTTRPVTSSDLERVSALHATVFGPGRYVRSAYRVREGKGQVSRFCRLAELNGKLVATLRLTYIAIGGADGAVLLGPLAVHPDFAGQGYGRGLVSEALDDMKKAGVKLVVLVGDEPYYGRFGFKLVAPGQIAFPGPVNPHRILSVELEPGALGLYRGLMVALPPGASGKS